MERSDAAMVSCRRMGGKAVPPADFQVTCSHADSRRPTAYAVSVLTSLHDLSRQLLWLDVG